MGENVITPLKIKLFLIFVTFCSILIIIKDPKPSKICLKKKLKEGTKYQNMPKISISNKQLYDSD